jgi:hypothetical protein
VLSCRRGGAWTGLPGCRWRSSETGRGGGGGVPPKRPRDANEDAGGCGRGCHVTHGHPPGHHLLLIQRPTKDEGGRGGRRQAPDEEKRGVNLLRSTGGGGDSRQAADRSTNIIILSVSSTTVQNFLATPGTRCTCSPHFGCRIGFPAAIVDDKIMLFIIFERALCYRQFFFALFAFFCSLLV